MIGRGTENDTRLGTAECSLQQTESSAYRKVPEIQAASSHRGAEKSRRIFAWTRSPAESTLKRHLRESIHREHHTMHLKSPTPSSSACCFFNKVIPPGKAAPSEPRLTLAIHHINCLRESPEASVIA